MMATKSSETPGGFLFRLMKSVMGDRDREQATTEKEHVDWQVTSNQLEQRYQQSTLTTAPTYDCLSNCSTLPRSCQRAVLAMRAVPPQTQLSVYRQETR